MFGPTKARKKNTKKTKVTNFSYKQAFDWFIGLIKVSGKKKKKKTKQKGAEAKLNKVAVWTR